MDMSREAVIILDFPVQLADRKVTEVTMRRPVMRDLIKHNITQKSDLRDDVNFIADLCNMTIEEMEYFDASDFEKLQAQLLRFRGVRS